jgi:hypothetical protein
MPDAVGTIGAMVDSWGGLLDAIDRPVGAQVSAADDAATDRDLAWQTTVGQIVFLESVIHTPT